MFEPLEPRDGAAADVRDFALEALPEPRSRLLERDTNERAFELDEAATVLVAGAGVGDTAAVDELRLLAGRLDAALGGDRRACEAGLVPPSRQIGLLGRSVAPRLYIAVETEGDFEHLVGSVKAGVILVFKGTRGPVRGTADIAVVGNWRETLPPLVDALAVAH